LAEGPLHGYGVIKAVEDRSDSGVFLDPANLYRVLRRMKGAGWIREAFPAVGNARGEGGATTDESPGDRRRKTYQITPSGRALLSAEVVRLERLLKFTRPALADGKGR
jgi:DNA-binding PadR family transcriptional regulator